MAECRFLQPVCLHRTPRAGDGPLVRPPSSQVTLLDSSRGWGRAAEFGDRFLKKIQRGDVYFLDLQKMFRGKPRKGHPHPAEPRFPTTRSIHDGPDVILRVPF